MHDQVGDELVLGEAVAVALGGVDVGLEVDQVGRRGIIHAFHLNRRQPDRGDPHLVLLDLVADRILAETGRLAHAAVPELVASARLVSLMAQARSAPSR